MDGGTSSHGQAGLVPFLKWAGGKRWLFTPEFVRTLPPFQRYVEPFLGGAAGFFALNPARAILSDVNPDLIELYETVRDCPAEIESALSEHHSKHTSDYYYEIRSSRPDDALSRASRMLYLNRTCWNGLYRLNRLGDFNVPIGTKTSVVLQTDNFHAASARLKNADLRSTDFEDTIAEAADGDLLFVDPPYTVRHNMNGFVKYNEKIFSWADQERLAQCVRSAANRGASVVVTNADHASVRELYADLGLLETAGRASVISGKVSGRAKTSELVVRL